MILKITILLNTMNVSLNSVKYLMSYKQIPGPKGIKFLGNIMDIKPYGNIIENLIH